MTPSSQDAEGPSWRCPTSCAPSPSRSPAGCPAIPRARHGRFRLRRHPAGRASVLQRRRPLGGGAGAPGPGRQGSVKTETVAGGVHQVPHRRPDSCLRDRPGRRRRLTSRYSTSRRASGPACRARRRRGHVGASSRALGEWRCRRARCRLEQRAPAAAVVRRGPGRADEVVDDLHEPLGWSLCGKWPALPSTSTTAPGATAAAWPRAAPGSRGRRVPQTTQHRHRLGQVGPVDHRDDLAAGVDHGRDDVRDRLAGTRVLEGVEDPRRPRRGRGSPGSPCATSARSPAVPSVPDARAGSAHP